MTNGLLQDIEKLVRQQNVLERLQSGSKQVSLSYGTLQVRDPLQISELTTDVTRHLHAMSIVD